MATSVLVSRHLRRCRFSLLRPLLALPIPNPNPPQPHPSSSDVTYYPFLASTTSFRCFSSRSSDSGVSSHEFNSVTESELRSLGLADGAQISDAVDGLLDDSILPIKALVSLLDEFHDLTGLPWWMVIASSTLALRITIFPWLLLQLHKLKKIEQLFPKLPPPLPPPFSGRSFFDQFSLFRRERQALGCPSFLWCLASFAVQVPCFILWMASIRRMSLDHHPGFDAGGIFWFQNLTELPNGVLGPVFPVLIAGLHFCNVQISFRSSSVGKAKGLLDLLAKLYRKYLELLTLPILFVGFHIPQGSLVYWVTNSSLTLIQQLCLQHPAIRQKLGLPDKKALKVAADSKMDITPSERPNAPRKPKEISAFNLSPRELVDYSIFYLSKGNKDRAIPLLRVALDKDPECFRALTVMGQVMVQQGLYEEATEYLDWAIAKISLHGEPTDAEAVDFLILASLSAGVAFRRRGKLAESLVHFERVRDMKEPEDQAAKARYYEGLVVYASILAEEGRKDEAAEYLRRAAAFDPQYHSLLKNLENEAADDFFGPLVSSRRADY